MRANKKNPTLFRQAGFAATAVAASSVAMTGAAVSWTTPTQNTNGTALTNLAGYILYYGTDSGCAAATKAIPISNPAATYAYLVDSDFNPNTTYYFSLVSLNNVSVISTCSNSASKIPNTGANGLGLGIATTVALTDPSVIPGTAYLYTHNDNGTASPVSQISIGGFSAIGISKESDNTGRLTLDKLNVGAIVKELNTANAVARTSSSDNYSATVGNVLNDSRDSSTGNVCRLYDIETGDFSFIRLNKDDFPGTLQGPFKTYPNAGANSVVDAAGTVTTKRAQEIRCITPPPPPTSLVSSALVSLVYAGGTDDKAVSIMGFPDAMFSIYAPQLRNVDNSIVNLTPYVSQTYLPAKPKDANGNGENYIGMANSGASTAPVLNVAYAQGTTVTIDQYSGTNNPMYAAAGTIKTRYPNCVSVYIFPAGTAIDYFGVQSDGRPRLWTTTQSPTGLVNNYTPMDPTQCNRGIETVALPTNPSGTTIPSTAVPIGPGG